MPAQLQPAACEQRFWARYGHFLFGEGRKPQTAQEWFDAGRQLRGLERFDEMAQRLEAAINVARQLTATPHSRSRHEQAGSVYYDSEGRACCPQHERPLKQGKWGWYCSARDDSTDSGYCSFKMKTL